jgi:amino acid transporter
MALLVYGVFTAVIEMSTYLPIPGSSISYYCSRYVSSSSRFSLGWLYVYSFGIIVAYEITAASLVIDYQPNNVRIAVWVTVLLLVIVGLKTLPGGCVRGNIILVRRVQSDYDHWYDHRFLGHNTRWRAQA